MGPDHRQGTPFPFEGPVPPDLLIGRDDELEDLARRAADRINVRLVAPRRYGKTSLLLAHAAQLRATGWRTVHVDFFRVTDLTDAARRIVVAYTKLDVGWVRDHLPSLLARLGVSISAQGPTVSLAPRPALPDLDAAETALLRFLDLPLTLREADRTPTLVVFDEFQDLLVARRDLDGLLRSRIQYHGDAAAYVYAGSEPSMLRELFDNRERPFYGQAYPVDLEPLPLDAAHADLAKRFADEQLDPGDALGELVAFAAGHPQRTMLLAYLLAERLARGARGTTATAAATIDDALRHAEPAHQALWAELGSTERVLLGAVADGIAPTSRALASEHVISRTTLARATRRLADQGHLIARPSPARLVDPLLAEWLRRR